MMWCLKPNEKKLMQFKEVPRIAPYGMKPADNPKNFPGGVSSEIYVMAFIPGGVSRKVDALGQTIVDHRKVVCELKSLTGFGAPMLLWKESQAKTHIKDLELYRVTDDMSKDEYNLFLSKPIMVTLDADDDRKIEYKDPGGNSMESDLRILPGDVLWAHLSSNFISTYNLENYIREKESTDIGDRTFSTRADIIDRRENFAFEGIPENEEEKPNSPTNNPSMYSGVLLHSGEFVYDDIDLHIPGRGFDFVFKRTYRSQCIYSGVLGWGWDHNYNRRLLELPGGDLIYYDGTGRRERYKAKKSGETITGYESPAGRFTEMKKEK